MSADAAPSSKPSILEDFVDILFQPATVFERRRETVAFGLALVILTVLSAVVVIATRSGFEPVLDLMVKQQTAEALRANPELKPEQMEGMVGTFKFGILATMVAYPLVAPLIVGILLWAIGKFFESRLAIGAAIMVATYAYVPRFLGTVVSGLLAVLLPEDQVTSIFSVTLSPARFFDPATTSIGILSLLARFDLFILWQTVVAGIGVSVLGGISWGKGMAVSFAVWFLASLTVLPALLR